MGATIEDRNGNLAMTDQQACSVQLAAAELLQQTNDRATVPQPKLTAAAVSAAKITTEQ